MKGIKFEAPIIQYPKDKPKRYIIHIPKQLFDSEILDPEKELIHERIQMIGSS